MDRLRNRQKAKDLIEARGYDKDITRLFRHIKEVNHEMAKQGKNYDRNIRYYIRYTGVEDIYHLYKYNEKRETIEPAVDFDDSMEVNTKFTKQFRHIMYLIRRVREYNELCINSNIPHRINVRYDGDWIEITKQEVGLKEEVLFELEIMSLPYNEATRAMAHMGQMVRTRGQNL